MKLSHLFLFGSLTALLAACGDGSGGSGGGGSTATGGTSAGGTTASGGTTSMGGTTANGGTTMTGTGGGDGCRSAADCDGSGAFFCAAYTLPPLCGGVQDQDFAQLCQTDAECMAGDICVDTLCIYPHGGAITPLHCRPGCTGDADCNIGSSCDAAHHCVQKSCTAAADCGSANFLCVNGECSPKDCQSDSDCENYCVNNACSETIGKCMLAVF